MSSSGHVESSVEEGDVGSGGGCGVEPRLLNAAGGGTGGSSIDNGLPPIVVVVSMDESSSKSILFNTPSSASYEIGLQQLNNRSCSSDSGDSNSQESVSINFDERNATPSDLHDPHSTVNEIEIEKKELIFPTSQDSSSSEKEILSISMSPDTLHMEANVANVSHILPHKIVDEESEDSPDSNPAAAATTNLDYTSIELPDTKESIDELCPVCGDKVSGYHYGLLTCESCKGFFKRTVQNKKVYTCVADRSCQIDKTQRKRCPFCRFNKCINVGMKLEAVRADRMRGGRNKFGPMYKRDRARKMQLMRQRQISHQGLMTSRGGSSSAIGITYSTAYSTTSPIKEEIQSPFLSSSTSSPDSSPAPMAGVGALAPPVGATLAVSPTGANATIMAGQELSLWVGTVPAGAPGPPTGGGGVPGGGGGGNSGNNAAGNGSSRVSIAGGAGSGAPTLNSGSGAGGGANGGGATRVPPLIRQLLSHVDDVEWQSSLYSLLQNQTYNQCEVDLFELLCKVLDQNLFSQVDWARNSYFFKDLRVDDQMKLLQNSWSDMLIIDHLHQRMHNKLQDEMQLPNGQKFDLLSLALLGTTQFADRFQHVMDKLTDLKFDVPDYICLKFIMLLSPETRNLNDRRSVSAAHDQVKQTLIDYCHAVHPDEQNRFQRLMELIPELHYIADNGERFLYFKHINGAAPSQTLLMEMLHTKRR